MVSVSEHIVGKEFSQVSEVLLRKIGLDDLSRVAKVHIEAFPESTLSKLGAGVVKRYYAWQLTGPHPTVRATAAYVGDRCVGFSFGGVFNGSVSGFIDRNLAVLVFAALLRPWVLMQRKYREQLFKGTKIRKKFRSRKNADAGNGHIQTPKIESFGILSVAVAPQYQRLRIGELLMHDAEEAAAQDGFKLMDLSVNPSNIKAIRFYEKHGWYKVPQGESWRGIMKKNLD
jgi:ribosomal protein S18 acetylase RimI-like enzyme